MVKVMVGLAVMAIVLGSALHAQEPCDEDSEKSTPQTQEDNTPKAGPTARDALLSPDESFGLFVVHCQDCHNPYRPPGEGGPDLLSLHWDDRQMDRAREVIKNGIMDDQGIRMPPFAYQLTTLEVESILNYMRERSNR